MWLHSIWQILLIFISYADLEEAATLLQSHFFGSLEKANLLCWFLIQNESEMEPLYLPENTL